MNFSKKDIILDSAIYYSLFQKIILNNIDKFLPSNAFGVFTTIRRYLKIIKWPEDVHGCIGYWDNNYQEIPKNALLDHLYRVSYDAMWKDNRKDYFPPIEKDPESFIEIDFMMRPIYPISNNGIIEDLKIEFNNNFFGIIAVGATGRATYLPNVFENISWEEMKKSIKNKAGIVGDANFFAYKIEQIKKRFCDIFESGVIGNHIITNFVEFLLQNSNFSLRYPFPYEVIGKEIIYNAEEEVRNIATIGDLVIYLKSRPHLAYKMEKIKKCIVKILQEKHSSQALSFLGSAITFFKLDKTNFCKQLTDDVNKVESEFSRQEVIIGLKKADCSIGKFNLSFTQSDSVFKMNWTIQALSATNQKISKKLVDIFVSKINIDGWETNYLAVCWEGLCYLLKDYPFVKIKMFEVWLELEKRKNILGLYIFTDKNARIDITGHVCNGYNILSKMQNKPEHNN